MLACNRSHLALEYHAVCYVFSDVKALAEYMLHSTNAHVMLLHILVASAFFDRENALLMVEVIETSVDVRLALSFFAFFAHKAYLLIVNVPLFLFYHELLRFFAIQNFGIIPVSFII